MGTAPRHRGDPAGVGLDAGSNSPDPVGNVAAGPATGQQLPQSRQLLGTAYELAVVTWSTMSAPVCRCVAAEQDRARDLKSLAAGSKDPR